MYINNLGMQREIVFNKTESVIKKPSDIRVLVGCEESQVVVREFRRMGFDAYSCDILPCSGDRPEWHIQGDLMDVIGGGWDVLLAFPPCTYLTVTANRWYKPEYAERYPTRQQDRTDAVDFFMKIANASIGKMCIENPVGIMSSRWRKPDQIIQPWQFGDRAVKKTCLWLKNLPKLVPTDIVEPLYKEYNSSTKKSGKSRYPMLWTGKADAKERSKTFEGIARAMAHQWGEYLLR